jgi:putative sporulation protein YtaF
MHILSILLFVISASLDNLVVGIAYGIKRLKISLLSNLLIAFISCAGTFLSMLVGKLIGHFISPLNANIIGSVILIILGLWFIISSLKKSKIKKEDFIIENPQEKQIKIEYYKCGELLESPEKADIDNSGNIDLKESLALGLALALNNMGLGIGASISGLSLTLTSLLTFIFSFVTIPIGYYVGKKFLSKILENKADMISGIIIIMLAIYQFFA